MYISIQCTEQWSAWGVSSMYQYAMQNVVDEAVQCKKYASVCNAPSNGQLGMRVVCISMQCRMYQYALQEVVVDKARGVSSGLHGGNFALSSWRATCTFIFILIIMHLLLVMLVMLVMIILIMLLLLVMIDLVVECQMEVRLCWV